MTANLVREWIAFSLRMQTVPKTRLRPVIESIPMPGQASSTPAVVNWVETLQTHTLKGQIKMIVAVFRSRLNDAVREKYEALAARLSGVVKDTPGYISHKSFTAADGERVTIVEFASDEGLLAWAVHPEHVEAKILGRKSLFSEYRIQICHVQRDSADRHSTS